MLRVGFLVLDTGQSVADGDDGLRGQKAFDELYDMRLKVRTPKRSVELSER